MTPGRRRGATQKKKRRQEKLLSSRLLPRRRRSSHNGLLLLDDLDPAPTGAGPVDPRTPVAAVQSLFDFPRGACLEGFGGELRQKTLEREAELVAVALEEEHTFCVPAAVIAHDLRQGGPQSDGLSRSDGPRRRVGVFAASGDDVGGSDLSPDEARCVLFFARRRRGRERLEDSRGPRDEGADADAEKSV